MQKHLKSIQIAKELQRLVHYTRHQRKRSRGFNTLHKSSGYMLLFKQEVKSGEVCPTGSTLLASCQFRLKLAVKNTKQTENSKFER